MRKALFIGIILITSMAMTACKSTPVDLEGTNWKVIEINGETILENSEITMEFNDGQIAGNASCNNYFAAYTLEGETLSFGPAGVTRMFCDGVMDQESLFLSNLDQVESFSLDGELLTLNLGDMGSIVLEPVEEL